MEKTNTIYFIDSENINDIWVNLFDTISENDKIIVFYTDKSAHISCDNVRRLMEIDKNLISWISCYCLNSNALDFQLVTELGSMIAKGSANEYIIVSNDTGFDSVVKYWSNRSVNIHRIRGNDCCTKTEKQTDNLKNKSHNEIHNFIGTKSVPPADSDAEKVSYVKVKAVQVAAPPAFTPDTELSSVINSLSKSMFIKSGTLLNNSLNNLYSKPREGTEIYNTLKCHPEYGQSLRKNLLKSRTARMENYISLVLKVSDSTITDTAEISKIIIKYLPEGSKKVHERLVKTVGQERANQIYKVLKKHFAVIKKL